MTNHDGTGERWSALWGKGGRGLACAAVALAALLAPVGAGAGGPKGWVAPGLLKAAQGKPDARIPVIIQAERGAAAAENVARGVGSGAVRRLDLVGGVATELPGKAILRLENVPGVSVVRDAPVKPDGYTSSQLWPFQNGASKLWGSDQNPAPKPPAIAFVDSGLEPGRADFGDRVKAVVDLTPLTPDSPGDGRGHGTFVAGIAAGSAPGYAGAAPNADIVMLDVMDDYGRARTSDVITAAAWIYAYRAAYGIRVANFSLHSTAVIPIAKNPLNKAVEKLWLAGVVVVASSGNYGTGNGPSGVLYAPANDPFVITVGALDLNGTAGVGDDAAAPWSAYGRTPEGFWKPEVCAAGRYMVGPIPAGSTLVAEKASSVVAPGYAQMSGTSFAAPVVAGVAAQLLALHPEWGPDQVKGALMERTRPVPNGAPWSCGVGEINALRSARAVLGGANPNLALNAFVVEDANENARVFDAVGWDGAARANVSWDSASWTDVSWTDVSWDSVSWADVSWDSVSPDSISWTDVSWEDVSWEDGAGDDVNASGGYALTPEEEAAVAADPELQLP